MTAMTQWNMRATWLMGQLDYAKDGPTVLDQSRTTWSKWQQLCDVVPARALEEAAHVGLDKGKPEVAVRDWRRGTLVLSGSVGTGKTVAAAWAAYNTGGACMWLNASEVALAEFKQVYAWIAESKTVALVVLDDVGAGSSGANWAAPKLSELMTSLTDRRGPTIINTNMSRAEITKAYTARVLSRIDQQPNAWVDCKGADRRKGRKQPLGLDVLPPREARALRLLHGYQVLERARMAQAVSDVDAQTVIAVARELGLDTYEALDWQVDASARRMAEVQAMMAGRVDALRYVPPDDDEEKAC